MDFHTIKWILSFDNWNQRIWLAKQARKDIRTTVVVTCRTVCSKLAFSDSAEFQMVCIRSCRICWMMMKTLGIVWSLLVSGVFCFNTLSRICIGVLKDGQGWYNSHAGAVSLQEKEVCQAGICRRFLLTNLCLQVMAVLWWKEKRTKVLPLVIVWMENDPTVWWLLRPASYFWFVKHLSAVTREIYWAEPYGFLFFFINVPLLVAKFWFINNTIYLVIINKT